MNQLDLSSEALDALIADTARRSPGVLPILRRVRDGEIAYIEHTRARTRILRLGPAGSLPTVVLITDAEGAGPRAFRLPFLRHLLSRSGVAVLLTCDDDPLAFELAAAHAGEGRRHVAVVECPRQAIEAWASLSCECGIAPSNLVTMLSDPRLPEGLIEDVPVEDIPPAKRGSLH